MTEPPKEPSFEQMLADLEAIVRQLEDGAIDLETALAQYERGIGLLRSCYDRLKNAETRILELTGVDEEGKPTFKPFEHESAVTKEPRKPRKRAESDG